MNKSQSIRTSIILTGLTIIVIIFIVISSNLLSITFPLPFYYIVIALTIISLIAALIQFSGVRNEKQEYLQQELLQIETQKADIEKRLELEKQELELTRERLELARQRLDLEKEHINYVLEIANKIVDTLYPNVGQQTKETIINALIPNLLQLSEVKGLELAPQEEQNEI